MSGAEKSETWRRLCKYLPYFVDLRNYIKEKCFVDSLCTESTFSRPRVRIILENVSPRFIEEIIKPWVMKWHKQYRESYPEPVFNFEKRRVVLEIPFGEIEAGLLFAKYEGELRRDNI